MQQPAVMRAFDDLVDAVVLARRAYVRGEADAFAEAFAEAQDAMTTVTGLLTAPAMRPEDEAERRLETTGHRL